MTSSSQRHEPSSAQQPPGHTKPLDIWFDHGLGDVVQFVHLLQLYQRRGYTVRVHYEGNKRPIFDAAGIPYWDTPKNYHHWRYFPDFNHPDPEVEGSGNKTYQNLNTETLPPIGAPADLWRELAQVNLEDGFDKLITPDVKAEVERFLEGLPRPVVLIHTHGSNFGDRKNIPADTAAELYRLLLAGMPGSLVLLDWDFRVPTPEHSRVRHIKRDWGHLTILQLAALMGAADLLIGIDSGPFHLANMTRLPSLGVFHQFFPWCVTLPRPSGRSTVLTRDSHHHCTAHRRKLWHPIEYPAPMPTADHIAKHALRMLAGPRYGLPLGRDVMLQHLVRDCQKPPPSNAFADRATTLDVVFRESGKLDAPRIVETGCVRSEEDWSAGYFGYLAGVLVDGKGKGELTSVDISPGNCETARRVCRDWPGEVVCQDSVAYLEARTLPVDCLYLDSLDTDAPGSAEHGLREAQAGERLVSAGGLIVLDDTWRVGHEWKGKGELAVPWLLSRGWGLLASGYQAVMRRG